MAITDGMMTSGNKEWETPLALVRGLEYLFGPFDLDPCATRANAKAKHFYTLADDGLHQSWHGNVFMNPPYGREISKWVEKAWQEASGGAQVICLLPARTDTTWWQRWVMKADMVIFMKGRVKFSGQKNGAPFPSAIVVFR